MAARPASLHGAPADGLVLAGGEVNQKRHHEAGQRHPQWIEKPGLVRRVVDEQEPSFLVDQVKQRIPDEPGQDEVRQRIGSR